MAVGPVGRYKQVADWYANQDELVKLYSGSVYIAAGAIARKIASTEAVVKRVRYCPKSGTVKKDRVSPNHPLCQLLQNPNDEDEPYDLHYLTTAWKLICGDAYIEQVPNGFGRPCRLHPMPPQWIKPIMSQHSLISGYRVDGRFLGCFQYDVPREEMIHIKENSLDKSNNRRFYGYPVPLAVQNAIELEHSMLQRLKYRFDNLAEPGLIFGTDERLSPASLKQRMHEVWSQHRFQEDTGKPMFLHNKTKLLAGGDGAKQKELDYRGSLESTRQFITSTIGVPLAVVGLVSDQNRANAEAALYTFAHNTVNPHLTQYSQVLTRQLARRFEPDLEIQLGPFRVIDLKDLIHSVEICLKGGAITPNEVRDVLMNLPPMMTGGDSPVLQAGMASSNFGNFPGTGLLNATGDELSGVSSGMIM